MNNYFFLDDKTYHFVNKLSSWFQKFDENKFRRNKDPLIFSLNLQERVYSLLSQGFATELMSSCNAND